MKMPVTRALTMIILLISTSHAAPTQPNVLFIAIDDLRTELGCYGHAHVQSPHLDRLAAQSVLFNNHFVQVPTCGASRYSLLTGRSPLQTGATRGNNHFFDGTTALKTRTEFAQTMPELFRRNGYKTVSIGKISHTADGKVFAYDGTGDGRDEMPNAWDELATPYGAWKRGWGVFFAYENGIHREDGSGYRPLMEFTVGKDTDLPDGLNAEVAVQKLRELEEAGQPFFMGLGFYKPHLPFVAPRQDWEALAHLDSPDAPNPNQTDSLYHNKESGEFYNYDFPFEKSHPLAPEARMQARKAYWACVRYVDRQVGKVLDALDELGLRENTIIVVWGDHGWNLGDTQHWAKHVPQERALKSTLIINAPGITPQNGAVTNSIVQTLDLYPTLIDLCQLKSTDTQHPLNGRSLRPILTHPKKSIHKTIISHWRDVVTIRNKQYRLIARLKDNDYIDPQLYDMQESPDPIKNLVAQNPKRTKKLLKQLP
ncbi:MAG: sulfatase [Candidatus Hydrogenedentota bacterium]